MQAQKTRMRLSAATIILMSLAGAGISHAAEVIKFGHVYPTDRRDHQCVEAAASELEKRTEGRFDVQIFPASQLGSEDQLHQQLTLGSVDMAIIAGPFASSLYPPLGVEVVPFAFRDFEHWKLYSKSDTFARLKDGYAATSGNKIVSTHSQGISHLLSNDPIVEPEQMRGLKMRVPNAPPWLVLPKATGAMPAPVAYAETYLALQQNLVDIMDQVPAGIKTMKFTEVRDTINLTGHILLPAHTIVGGPLWNRLSESDRATFTEVFQAAADECSELINADEQKILDEFRQNGIEIVEVNKPAFMGTIDRYIEKEGGLGWKQEDLDAIRALK